MVAGVVAASARGHPAIASGVGAKVPGVPLAAPVPLPLALRSWQSKRKIVGNRVDAEGSG